MNKNFYIGICVLFLMLYPAVSSSRGASGQLDTTFDNDGKVTTCCGNAAGQSVAIQSDGKIVVAGSRRNLTTFFFDIWLVRYNLDGAIDTSFGTAGTVTTQTAANNNDPAKVSIAIQSDDKIVVSTWASGSGGFGTFVYRYTANGVLDPGFGNNGIVNVRGVNYTDVYLATSLAIQPDGRILVAVRYHEDVLNSPIVMAFGVLRFDLNGSLDPTFGAGGFVFTPSLLGNPQSQDVPLAIAAQPDGKIVMVGLARRSNGTTTFGVVRYNGNGSLDASFDGDGIVTTQIGITGDRDEPYSVGIQSDGKIVAAGLSRDNTVFESVAVVRYNTNGSLDTSFDSDGKVMTAGGAAIADRLVIQLNGKIVVGGGGTGDFLLVRYRANGSLDTNSWGTGGKVSTDFGGSENVNSLAIQTDGRIVAAGNTSTTIDLGRYFGDAGTNFDYDRDGKPDVSVFRPAEGNWYVLRSSNGSVSGLHWGIATDELAPADYDGDLKTDFAVWRAGAVAFLYVLNSSNNTVRIEQFGQTGDDPSVIGDYDGDGKADPAVYRNSAVSSQSYFYYRGSFNNPAGNTTYVPWGTTGDVAARGDYTGDGRLDPTVFRPSNGVWYSLNLANNAVTAAKWGLFTDKIAPADYDADGKTDYAVFRSGVWYILPSNSGIIQYTYWGLPTDSLVPADYDGDGRADVAVYRGGIWYVQRSTGGVSAISFGLSTDIPTPAAYQP